MFEKINKNKKLISIISVIAVFFIILAVFNQSLKIAQSPTSNQAAVILAGEPIPGVDEPPSNPGINVSGTVINGSGGVLPGSWSGGTSAGTAGAVNGIPYGGPAGYLNSPSSGSLWTGTVSFAEAEGVHLYEVDMNGGKYLIDANNSTVSMMDEANSSLGGVSTTRGTVLDPNASTVKEISDIKGKKILIMVIAILSKNANEYIDSNANIFSIIKDKNGNIIRSVTCLPVNIKFTAAAAGGSGDYSYGKAEGGVVGGGAGGSAGTIVNLPTKLQLPLFTVTSRDKAIINAKAVMAFIPGKVKSFISYLSNLFNRWTRPGYKTDTTGGGGQQQGLHVQNQEAGTTNGGSVK